VRRHVILMAKPKNLDALGCWDEMFRYAQHDTSVILRLVIHAGMGKKA
jgi:hypothetical protein